MRCDAALIYAYHAKYINKSESLLQIQRKNKVTDSEKKHFPKEN